MEKLLKNIANQVQQAEVYLIEESSLPVQFNQAQVSRIDEKKTTGISLRIIDNEGRLGMATATVLDQQDLIERALQSARFGEKSEIKFPAKEGNQVQCLDQKIAEMDVKEIINQGQTMINTIQKLDASIPFDLRLQKDLQNVKIMNTSGLNVSYQKTKFTIGLMSKSEDGFREFADWDTYSKHFTFDNTRLAEFVHYHQLAKKSFQVETGKMDIIFAPGAMWPLLYRVFAGVNGNSINQKTSPLTERLGEKVFNDLITFVDDPTQSWGFASTPYDDEGTMTERTAIVENGILKNYLFDLNSAAQYGSKSTGNGFKKTLFTKGIDLQPGTYASNFSLLPGEHSFAEMVKSIKRGIIVSQTMGGHTGNVQAGEFGLTIGSGYLVEDGEIKGKVMDTMVSGNIYDLFNQVSMVGQESRATQAVFFGMGYSPAILVPGLMVAGN